MCKCLIIIPLTLLTTQQTSPGGAATGNSVANQQLYIFGSTSTVAGEDVAPALFPTGSGSAKERDHLLGFSLVEALLLASVLDFVVRPRQE
jgi:hypothetical protein